MKSFHMKSQLQPKIRTSVSKLLIVLTPQCSALIFCSTSLDMGCVIPRSHTGDKVCLFN